MCYACYHGIMELLGLLQNYIEFTKDVKILWFNLGYNFGGIVTSIKNIWMWNVAKEYTRINDSFTMGMEMGQIFWMIFYPTEKYLDESLADPNSVWGQDYTWDAIIFRRELEPDEEYIPLIDQPGLTVDSESAQADEVIEEASFSLSTDVLDFLSKYVPLFKTKRSV